MDEHTYRALVVDDENPVRALTVASLTREGIECDEATDGDVALRLCRATAYDVVVTDLRMPRKHGHALAVDLLEHEARPAIVVFTGLAEPRLVKDLLARGVDDVVFKPIDFTLLAAKVKSLVGRRREKSLLPRTDDPAPADSPASSAAAPAEFPANVTAAALSTAPIPAAPACVTPVSASPVSASPVSAAPVPAALAPARMALGELEAKLADVSRVLPISPVAVDIFNMARLRNCDAAQFAEVIKRDPALSIEIIRLANSPVYNPLGECTADLVEAVTRLGQKRIGEIALTVNALGKLAPDVFPAMNVDLEWRRSIAAATAIGLLVVDGQHAEIEEGLLLGALAHGIGRILLATLFPKDYQEMLAQCRLLDAPLIELERQRFPENHASVMARMLAMWNVPSTVYHPLTYTLDDYESLARHPEPVRTKAELLKLAILIGRIAAGDWNAWDLVELPPRETLRRLRIRSLPVILAATRSALLEIMKVHHREPPPARAAAGCGSESPSRPLAYVDLSGDAFDFFAELIAAMNIPWESTSAGGIAADRAAVANCLGAPADVAAAWLAGRGAAPTLIVGRRQAAPPRDVERPIEGRVDIPTSHGAVRSAPLRIAGADR